MVAGPAKPSVTRTGDNTETWTLTYTGAAKLAKAIDASAFGEALLAYVRQAAPIHNFGAFYVSEIGKVTPVLSVWSGSISDYRFRRNAATLLADPAVRQEIVDRIRAAPVDGALMERWRPTEDDPRFAMYERAGVLEKIAISTRLGRGGLQSFFLRSHADGWLTNAEMSRLEDLLPLVHEIIGLRHRIVGSELFQFRPGPLASSLRERNVATFARLSEREAQVCDAIAEGLSVAGTAAALGITENSVRTLRRRAFRKLNVSAASEVMALMLFEGKHAV